MAALAQDHDICDALLAQGFVVTVMKLKMLRGSAPFTPTAGHLEPLLAKSLVSLGLPVRQMTLLGRGTAPTAL
jgi:hypothetical protein